MGEKTLRQASYNDVYYREVLADDKTWAITDFRLESLVLRSESLVLGTERVFNSTAKNAAKTYHSIAQKGGCVPMCGKRPPLGVGGPWYGAMPRPALAAPRTRARPFGYGISGAGAAGPHSKGLAGSSAPPPPAKRKS